MRPKRALLLFVLLLAGGGAALAYKRLAPPALILTGIVTTNDLIVSPQIGGRIEQLLVGEGDAVAKDQLVAVIAPDELKADTAYFAQNVEGLSSQVRESEAALRYQQRLTIDQIRQAESTLASSEAQVDAAAADVESARLTDARTRNLALRGVATAGVYIGGGIAPKILPAIRHGGFMAAFSAKAPMTELLARMPVKVILNPEAGLLGAAVHAQEIADPDDSH